MSDERSDKVELLPPSGSGFRGWLGRSILGAYGWHVAGGLPKLDKAVVVAAPHTTNWDLPFTLGVAWSLGMDMKWIGKHTLFKPPFGFLMRALGGVPVDRRGSNNAVDAIANLIRSSDRLMLIIPPEGTRSKASRWKTGFYYIALEAKVPIILGYLDYSRKEGGLAEVFWPTGDIHADFDRIRAFYADKKGKYPEFQGEITVEGDGR